MSRNDSVQRSRIAPAQFNTQNLDQSSMTNHPAHPNMSFNHPHARPILNQPVYSKSQQGTPNKPPLSNSVPAPSPRQAYTPNTRQVTRPTSIPTSHGPPASPPHFKDVNTSVISNSTTPGPPRRAQRTSSASRPPQHCTTTSPHPSLPNHGPPRTVSPSNGVNQSMTSHPCAAHASPTIQKDSQQHTHIQQQRTPQRPPSTQRQLSTQRSSSTQRQPDATQHPQGSPAPIQRPTGHTQRPATPVKYISTTTIVAQAQRPTNTHAASCTSASTPSRPVLHAPPHAHVPLPHTQQQQQQQPQQQQVQVPVRHIIVPRPTQQQHSTQPHHDTQPPQDMQATPAPQLIPQSTQRQPSTHAQRPPPTQRQPSTQRPATPLQRQPSTQRLVSHAASPSPPPAAKSSTSVSAPDATQSSAPSRPSTQRSFTPTQRPTASTQRPHTPIQRPTAHTGNPPTPSGPTQRPVLSHATTQRTGTPSRPTQRAVQPVTQRPPVPQYAEQRPLPSNAPYTPTQRPMPTQPTTRRPSSAQRPPSTQRQPSTQRSTTTTQRQPSTQRPTAVRTSPSPPSTFPSATTSYPTALAHNGVVVPADLKQLVALERQLLLDSRSIQEKVCEFNASLREHSDVTMRTHTSKTLRDNIAFHPGLMPSENGNQENQTPEIPMDFSQSRTSRLGFNLGTGVTTAQRRTPSTQRPTATTQRPEWNPTRHVAAPIRGSDSIKSHLHLPAELVNGVATSSAGIGGSGTSSTAGGNANGSRSTPSHSRTRSHSQSYASAHTSAHVPTYTHATAGISGDGAGGGYTETSVGFDGYVDVPEDGASEYAHAQSDIHPDQYGRTQEQGHGHEYSDVKARADGEDEVNGDDDRHYHHYSHPSHPQHHAHNQHHATRPPTPTIHLGTIPPYTHNNNTNTSNSTSRNGTGISSTVTPHITISGRPQSFLAAIHNTHAPTQTQTPKPFVYSDYHKIALQHRYHKPRNNHGNDSSHCRAGSGTGGQWAFASDGQGAGMCHNVSGDGDGISGNGGGKLTVAQLYWLEKRQYEEGLRQQGYEVPTEIRYYPTHPHTHPSAQGQAHAESTENHAAASASTSSARSGLVSRRPSSSSNAGIPVSRRGSSSGVGGTRTNGSGSIGNGAGMSSSSITALVRTQRGHAHTPAHTPIPSRSHTPIPVPTPAPVPAQVSTPIAPTSPTSTPTPTPELPAKTPSIEPPPSSCLHSLPFSPSRSSCASPQSPTPSPSMAITLPSGSPPHTHRTHPQHATAAPSIAASASISTSASSSSQATNTLTLHVTAESGTSTLSQSRDLENPESGKISENLLFSISPGRRHRRTSSSMMTPVVDAPVTELKAEGGNGDGGSCGGDEIDISTAITPTKTTNVNANISDTRGTIPASLIPATPLPELVLAASHSGHSDSHCNGDQASDHDGQGKDGDSDVIVHDDSNGNSINTNVNASVATSAVQSIEESAHAVNNASTGIHVAADTSMSTNTGLGVSGSANTSLNMSVYGYDDDLRGYSLTFNGHNGSMPAHRDDCGNDRDMCETGNHDKDSDAVTDESSVATGHARTNPGHVAVAAVVVAEVCDSDGEGVDLDAILHAAHTRARSRAQSRATSRTQSRAASPVPSQAMSRIHSRAASRVQSPARSRVPSPVQNPVQSRDASPVSTREYPSFAPAPATFATDMYTGITAAAAVDSSAAIAGAGIDTGASGVDTGLAVDMGVGAAPPITNTSDTDVVLSITTDAGTITGTSPAPITRTAPTTATSIPTDPTDSLTTAATTSAITTDMTITGVLDAAATTQADIIIGSDPIVIATTDHASPLHSDHLVLESDKMRDSDMYILRSDQKTLDSDKDMLHSAEQGLLCGDIYSLLDGDNNGMGGFFNNDSFAGNESFVENSSFSENEDFSEKDLFTGIGNRCDSEVPSSIGNGGLDCDINNGIHNSINGIIDGNIESTLGDGGSNCGGSIAHAYEYESVRTDDPQSTASGYSNATTRHTSTLADDTHMNTNTDTNINTDDDTSVRIDPNAGTNTSVTGNTAVGPVTDIAFATGVEVEVNAAIDAYTANTHIDNVVVSASLAAPNPPTSSSASVSDSSLLPVSPSSSPHSPWLSDSSLCSRSSSYSHHSASAADTDNTTINTTTCSRTSTDTNTNASPSGAPTADPNTTTQALPETALAFPTVAIMATANEQSAVIMEEGREWSGAHRENPDNDGHVECEAEDMTSLDFSLDEELELPM